MALCLSGFSNPIINLFDPDLEKQGTFQLKFTMPHSDLDLTEEERHKWYPDEPINSGAFAEKDQFGGADGCRISNCGPVRRRLGRQYAD
jgi:hypothetical protein